MHLFPANLQVLEMSDSEEPSAQLRGLKTLLLRMRAHEAGARVVASFLAAHPAWRTPPR